MDNNAGAELYGLLINLIGSYLCETFFFGATMSLIHSAWLSRS
jgi:hypothetical protein